MAKPRDSTTVDMLKRKAVAWCQKNRPDWDETARFGAITGAITGAMIQSIEERKLAEFLKNPKNLESAQRGTDLASGVLQAPTTRFGLKLFGQKAKSLPKGPREA